MLCSHLLWSGLLRSDMDSPELVSSDLDCCNLFQFDLLFVFGMFSYCLNCLELFCTVMIWTGLSHLQRSGQVSVGLVSSALVWSHVFCSLLFWSGLDCTGLSGMDWVSLFILGLFWSHLIWSEPFLSGLVLSRLVWSHLDRSGLA